MLLHPQGLRILGFRFSGNAKVGSPGHSTLSRFLFRLLLLTSKTRLEGYPYYYTIEGLLGNPG